jgi:hypothetical protein
LILFSSSYPERRQEYRSWSRSNRAYGQFSYDYLFSGNGVFQQLPSSPTMLAVRTGGWRVDLIDMSAQRIAYKLALPGNPTSLAVAERRGWYAIGDMTGRIGRYSLETHEKLVPEIHHTGRASSTVVTGDNRWLISTETLRDESAFIHAWLLGGGHQVLGLKLPIPYNGGQLFPFGLRGVVYQDGTKVRHINLPSVTLQPSQLEAATMAALGVRKERNGELRLLTSEEFQAAKAHLPAE